MVMTQVEGRGAGTGLATVGKVAAVRVGTRHAGGGSGAARGRGIRKRHVGGDADHGAGDGCDTPRREAARPTNLISMVISMQ